MASSLMSFPSCVKLLSEPLFLPRIAAHVIAPVFPFLPEAGPVLVHQLDSADPLGAFPGVKPRHDQAQRIAVVWLQGLAVVLPGKEAILAEEIVQRQVGREPLLAVDHDVRRFQQHLYGAENRSRRDAFPDVTQLAPARDTVHVGQYLDARQSNELVIIALPRRFDKAPDTERPLGAPVLVCPAQGIEVGIVRDTAGVQDRPLAGQNLPRRKSVVTLHVGAGDAKRARARSVSDLSNF